jgi:hypothetical protein
VVLLYAQNADLPGPTPNLQTLPSGSYVIAMDNSLQLNAAGDFNLKAYGLIVYLLNNSVRIKWSIKTGKAKDGIDFTAMAEQIKPTLVSGGVSRDFKAGPFVIFASDTLGVAALIDAFYTANSLSGSNRPQVYRLTADAANVDIRYDLAAFRPKAAILTDGGNQNIHLAYMTAASIPTESYATSQGTDLLTNCFTFASEPHNSKTGTAVNDAISAIRDFVTKGGNFLAQCEAVNNYENNTLGRFQTTGGITVSNTSVGTSLTYPNPDLSFSQFEGNYNASIGGSVKNWKVVGSTINNEHDHATGTGSNTNVIGASVSKHYYDKGGLVFYIGNHSFSTSTPEGINGIRMYMDAFLTPSNTNCPELVFTPLALKLIEFSGNNQNGQTKLSWRIANNENVKQFVVENSSDGKQFTAVGYVTPSTTTGSASYRFSDTKQTAKAYYRLKITDRQKQVQYSQTVSLSGQTNEHPDLRILSIGGKHDVAVSYLGKKNDLVNFTLYNSMGSKLFSTSIKIVEGMNIILLPANSFKSKGIYFLVAVDQSKSAVSNRFLKFDY